MAKKWSDVTTYKGKKVNEGTKQHLEAAAIILRNSPYYGKEKEDPTITQGGYNKGGVPQSAGTHDGGAAYDMTSFNWINRVKVYRTLGAFASRRFKIPGHWNDHIHGVMDGDGTASRGALNQIKDYHKGLNGLANRGKDQDWRPYKLPILFKLNGDKSKHYVVRDNYPLKDQPYSKGKTLKTVKKGVEFNPVAWVRNAYGNYWAVNKNGEFAFQGALSKTKPAPDKEPLPVSFTTRVATKNIIYKRMSNYAQRIKWIADELDRGTTIVCTQEAGGLQSAGAFNKELERSFNAPWGYHIWGDGFDLSNGIHFRTDVYTDSITKPLVYKPSPKGTHRVAAAQRLIHKGTKVPFWAINPHLWYVGADDDVRYQQFKDLIKIVEAETKGEPYFIIGDLNSYLEKAYDGPGKAAKEAGLIDVESTTCPVENPEYASYTGENTTAVKNSRQIDRCIFKPGKITAKRRIVKPRIDKNGKYKLPKDSDHLTLEFDLEFTK